jgi:cell division transport system permease protein
MMRNYLLRHAQVFLYTLGQLARSPITTLMTLLVIAITLVLPTGLYVLLENLQTLGGSFGDSVRITVFLDKTANQDQTDALLSRLRADQRVLKIRYLTPGQALDDFKSISGFGSVIDRLGENPLPGVITVIPSAGQLPLNKLEALAADLGKMDHVDFAQLDSQWVERLRILLQLGTRGVYILATLLALGVLLIIGNTIRLAVLNRRREIEIIKLVGGTDAFVRRPFLYNGTLQGGIGAIVAVGLLYAVLAGLAGPVADLSLAYGGRFSLRGPGLAGSGLLILAGGALGWLGARLAVWRHLRDIEPD